MVTDILLTKAFNSKNLYFIFMNADNKLIDTDWEAVKADYNKMKGITLTENDKKLFIVIYTIENGFIWIERDQLFRFSRPLTRPEISNNEFGALNNSTSKKSRYINNDYYYANVYDFLEDTQYKIS